MAILNNALAVVILSGAILYISYKLYGTFLARKVFGFDDSQVTPAVERNDGVDFVPTRPSVLFGHHFASIAGLGPIIGPAIAVYWGWLPAIAWVLAGCILIGGVHDLAALYASLRFKARGIGDLTNEIIGPRARGFFLIIIFFLLALAMGVFAIVMANLFNDLSPQAVVPTFSLILIAMVIGVLTFKLGWSLGRVTVIGVVLMMITTYVGLELPVPLYKMFVTDSRVHEVIATTEDPDLPHVHGIRATRADMAASYFERRAETDETFKPLAADVAQARERSRSTWVYILVGYAFVASVLPVWLLLQPRDYINCFQLYIGLGVLVLGFVIWHPTIQAPAYGTLPAAQGDAAPPVLPFIFITIACGAVSGFHNLVSSGTTARQIRRESDAKVIGYGGMLTEGFLAVLVILACVAGLSKADYGEIYGSWGALNKGALGAFLKGAGTVISKPFLPLFAAGAHQAVQVFCVNFIAVVVVSFAMTTLDSATRLLRYNIEEIGKSFGLPFIQNRYLASMIAVISIAYFALIKIGGKPAGLTLWQLFGTTNQLLAALGLLVATVLLYQFGKAYIYALVPMIVMFASVTWAIAIKLGDFYRGWRADGDAGNLSLLIVGSALAVMAVWMVIEALLAFNKPRGQVAYPAEAPTE